MLRRKAANLAATSRVATTTVARKTAAALRVVLNLVAQRSAALTIARLKLPVPPHPALSRKSPFFFPASLLPSIAASLWPRLFRQSSSRNLMNRNPKSKKQLRARQVT